MIKSKKKTRWSFLSKPFFIFYLIFHSFISLSLRMWLMLASIFLFSSYLNGSAIDSEQLERNIIFVTACGSDGTRNGTCPSDRGTCAINPLANNFWSSEAYCVCKQLSIWSFVQRYNRMRWKRYVWSSSTHKRYLYGEMCLWQRLFRRKLFK